MQVEPQHWVNTANLTLLGEVRRKAPEAIDWDAMGGVVPVLDAFEAARRAGRRADIDGRLPLRISSSARLTSATRCFAEDQASR